ILVYRSTASARTVHQYIQNFATKDMDADGFTEKPIPITLWPPGERTKSLAKGQGLKGIIHALG
ncbi:uncharacterized protein F5891DRAFT_956853, partial [Suillus fuscotomentosus]